jgi:phosphopantetheine adenylyltransferase
MTSAENLFLSSSTIKELVSLGGSPEGMVPNSVALRLVERYKRT